MGCPSEITLGQNLTFSVCTHDPATGILTDADAPPQYRIYEDETGTVLLAGSMAKLDDVNTVGFYTEQIACVVANGFEAGKTYSIYISAAVGGDTGGIAFGFQALADPWRTALAEGYAADGAAPTPEQLLFMIWAMLAEKTVDGVTLTVKRLDGTTQAMSFTLNDENNPTSITRAT